MDPLPSNEQEEKDESTLENITKNSIIIVSGTGEVHLQLEGTHTTSTETESFSLTCKEKKNVKFEDEIAEVKAITSETSPSIYKEALEEKEEIEIKSVLEISQADVKEETESVAVAKEEEDTKECVKTKNPLYKSELKEIGQENKEIAERFKQIMEMFENFSRNLECLDLDTHRQQSSSGGIILGTTKRKRPKGSASGDNIKKQRKDFDRKTATPVKEFKVIAIEDYLKEQQTRETILESLEAEPPLITLKMEAQTLTSSISTNTSSCDFTPSARPCQNFGSQTLGSDHYSLNDLSLLEVSSITSQSEALNSLNNYAQPENALELPKQLQTPIVPPKPLRVSGVQESVATSLTERRNNNDWEPLTQVVVDQPSNQNIHTIHIETNSVPSASDLRRAPLCQRLWTVLGDFCAATFLCLQVNRDCIFCLGFFAAFVVSASFLTAFFYHTLSVSPSLWQTTGDTMRL